jgi:uncharacterized protein
MDESLMELLCCPECKGELELEVRERDEDSGEILEGSLTCSACPFTYPIEEGIPNLLPPALQEAEKQEGGKEAAA